jgi:hypothetical protein
MRRVSTWAHLLRVAGTMVENVGPTDGQELVVSLRPDRRHSSRCGLYGRRAARAASAGEACRRWQALDLALRVHLDLVRMIQATLGLFDCEAVVGPALGWSLPQTLTLSSLLTGWCNGAGHGK